MLSIVNIPEKPVTFVSLHQPERYKGTRKNLSYLISLAKVYIPVYLQFLE